MMVSPDQQAREDGPKAPLLPRIARGDALAVRELVTRYERLLWALAQRYCSDRADAEDAIQDVFLAIWQSASRFDAERASEPVFVTVIARRRLLDRARGRSRRPVTELFDETTLGNDDLHPERCAEAAGAVRAMGTLSTAQRTVLVLSTRDGLTHEEIAEATGFPLGTVKTHARRALSRIRAMLSGDEPGSEDP